MQIIPAILEKNFKEIKRKILFVDEKFDPIQIDICQKPFAISNTWNNPKDLKSLKTKSSFEVHLMVLNPEKQVKNWLFKKIKRIVFHYENLDLKNLNWLKPLSQKKQIGIALNPKTEIKELKNIPLYCFSEILFLGVNPGKQGQKFQEKTLKKIAAFKKANWKPKSIKIAVDGGINDKILVKLDKLKVDYAVIGSYFWKNTNLK